MTRLARLRTRVVEALPDWIVTHPRAVASMAVIALIAASITAWRGGFRAVPDAPLPAFTAEATITTNEWRLRPLGAWLGDRDPTGRRAPAGGAILVIELMAENRTDRSSGSITQALRFVDARDTARNGAAGADQDDPARQGRTPSLILLRDPSFGAIVHPGLPERVAATWDLPASAPAPAAKSVTVRVIGREWIERDSLIGGSGWMRDRPVGELTLPIEDRRGTAPDAPLIGGAR